MIIIIIIIMIMIMIMIIIMIMIMIMIMIIIIVIVIGRNTSSCTCIAGCGGTVNAETDGAIISPNYPLSYPRRSNCSWLIRADHNSKYIHV